MTSTIVLIVAMAAGLVTFFVAHQVFQERLKLGPPSLLAALTAGLAFLALSDGGKGLVSVLFLPYEALALTLLLFMLFRLLNWFSSNVNHSRTRPSRPRGYETLRRFKPTIHPMGPLNGPASQSPRDQKASSIHELPGARAPAKLFPGERSKGLTLPHASTPLRSQAQPKESHER
jgi:hypothetical protein